MAVEDHSQSPEWNEALNRLVKARDDLNQIKTLGYPDYAGLGAKQAELDEAMSRFREVSDKIDA